MKWFKQLIEKFSSKEDEEQFWEEDIEEDVETEIKLEQNDEKKKSFRFPIIDDAELNRSTSHIDSHNFQQNLKKESVPSEVYDVDEPKIRDLLEQRRKKIKYSYHPTDYKPKSIKLHEPIKIQEPIKHQPIKQKKLEKVEKEPTYIRKRFIPTDVPSPVYGFQKRKTLEKKEEPISKENDVTREQEVAATVNLTTSKETVHNEVNGVNSSTVQMPKNLEEEKFEGLTHTVEMDVDLADADDSTQIENNEDLQTQFVDETIVEEDFIKLEYENEELEQNQFEEIDETQQNQSEVFVASSFDMKEETLIENDVKRNDESIVQLDNEKVELEHSDFQVESEDWIEQNIEMKKDFNEDTTDEERIEEGNFEAVQEEPKQPIVQKEASSVKNEEPPKTSTGSKLPFNVLMLKSDKEKLAKKLAQQKTLNEPSSSHLPQQTNHEVVDSNETNKVGLYKKPPMQFLTPPEEKIIDQEWMESQADKLVEALSYFQISSQVESIMQGPAVTQFEITVAHGIKVSKIRNLADDLKLALAAKDIRIQAPIPGKSTIGIEIPNRISRAVRLSEVVSSESFLQSDSPLEAALGLDLTGKPVTIDLRKMPHGLIAGATGSGKSVCINSILVSLLYKADPNELKLMLIDPKMVELAPFNNIPHLVSPVITDVKAATAALKWAVEEMERRYQLFANSGVRDLPRYNKLALQKNEPTMPYILIVIDELADLMMMSPADVEEAICRIAQKARACGIHLIVATQRPSVDVITGLIKSNIPTRIAFSVSSQVDSRTILDQQGAERLLGRGDMLYLGNGMSAPIRIQGTFVTDDEIEMIVDYIREQGEPNYFFQQEELLRKSEIMEEQDELFEEVCRFVAEQGAASTSSIQRKYHIGYNRAARLIDMLEQQGFISEQRGSKPREVYITVSDVASMFKE